MASIRAYKTAAGTRYEVRYRTPDQTETGKRGFTRKRDAETFLHSLEASKSRGDFIEASSARVTIGELGPQWLANQSHLKPSSARSLEIAWRVYVEPKWGSRQVGGIRHSEVQTWVSGIAMSATTVVRAYGVLAAILDVAVKDRCILENPARGVNLPRKVPREHRYLSHDDVSKLAVAAGANGLIVLVLAYCGLRWGEAAGLRVKDLDMLRRRINVTQNAVEVGDRIEVGTPKSHKRRSVPFPALLAVPLAQACEGKGRDDLVFTSPRGGFVKRSRSDTGWFQAAVREAGLSGQESITSGSRDPDLRGRPDQSTSSERLTPHTLRHTAASLAIAAGANVKAVQRMMGHASAAMTLDVYADLFDDDLDPIADKLNEGLAATVVGGRWAEKS